MNSHCQFWCKDRAGSCPVFRGFRWWMVPSEGSVARCGSALVGPCSLVASAVSLLPLFCRSTEACRWGLRNTSTNKQGMASAWECGECIEGRLPACAPCPPFHHPGAPARLPGCCPASLSPLLQMLAFLSEQIVSSSADLPQHCFKLVTPLRPSETGEIKTAERSLR